MLAPVETVRQGHARFTGRDRRVRDVVGEEREGQDMGHEIQRDVPIRIDCRGNAAERENDNCRRERDEHPQLMQVTSDCMDPVKMR